MGGWAEEIFWSKLQIGHLMQELNLPDSIVLECYKDAYIYRPHRAETIYFIAEICNRLERYSEAYAYLKMYESTPKPPQKDALFNLDWIEDYGLLFQFSICSYYVEKHQESLESCDRLLAIDSLPEHLRFQTQENRKFPLSKLEEIDVLKENAKPLRAG